MRPRLVHTLSLWLLASVAISVLAMGGITAWHLGQGFSAYLRARDIERLDRFAAQLVSKLQAAGGLQALNSRQVDWSGVLQELALEQGDAPARPGPPARGPLDGVPPLRGAPPPWMDAKNSLPLPPAGGPGSGFGDRVALFDLQGRQIAGNQLDARTGATVERRLVLAGVAVAVLRMQPIQLAPDANEVRFLRSQYLGMAWGAGFLLLAALAAAVWLARQWARPLAAVQEATARIAKGELDVRVPQVRRDEIGDVVRNVNVMAESLQRMEGARRRWMADISHELRTPLASLRGETEALLDGVRPLTRDAVQSLHEDMLRLGALVEDLHLLALADLQSLPCRLTDVDAVDLVRDTVRRFETRASVAGLDLRCATLLSRLDVLCDPSRIEQLLSNLLENSLRYTDSPGRIEVGIALEAHCIVLSVADSAPGVKPEDLDRLFEPLFRADDARGRHNGGSGLGLAICQAIAQAHGGYMTAAPSALGGLKMTATLAAQGHGGCR